MQPADKRIALVSDVNAVNSRVDDIEASGVGDLGEAVKTAIEPGGAASGTLSAAIADKTALKADRNQATILPASNIVGCVGDSITNASGATSGNGYAQILRYVAGTRNVDQSYRIYATGGWASTQILGTHVPAACAGDAAVVHIAWGTNDAGTGVSVAKFAENTTEAHRQITAAGKKMTISLIPPRASNATATWRKDRGAYNEWINRWAPLNGIPVANTNTLVDPTTGHLAAVCDSGDGTHPNDVGHTRLAVAVSKAVLEALPEQPHRPVRAPDVNLIPNGAVGVTPSPGMPAQWAESSGGTGTEPTYSSKADTGATLREGLWLEMDWDATSGGVRTVRQGGLTKGAGWAAGDQLEMGAVIELEDVAGLTAAIQAGTASVQFLFLATDGVSIQATAIPELKAPPGKAAYRFGAPNTTYPSIAVRVTLPSGVHAKIRVGEATVFNLAAMGLTKSVVGS